MHDPEERQVIRQTVPKVIGSHDDLHVERITLNVQVDDQCARIIVADVGMFLGVQRHHSLFGIRVVTQAIDCVLELSKTMLILVMEQKEPIVAVDGFSVVGALAPELAHLYSVFQLTRSASVKVQFLLKVLLRGIPSKAIRRSLRVEHQRYVAHFVEPLTLAVNSVPTVLMDVIEDIQERHALSFLYVKGSEHRVFVSSKLRGIHTCFPLILRLICSLLLLLLRNTP